MQIVATLLFISSLLSITRCQEARQDCKQNDPIKTINVDRSKEGHFGKIQEAIDSIPVENTEWIRIQIAPGDYLGKVVIPQNKRCIILEGAGTKETYVKWSKAAEGNTSTIDSATFTSEASDIVVKGITFENKYPPIRDGKEDVKQAVAVEINGDRSAFYDCAFIGIQDTLADVNGKHYFKNCHIEGAIDFIFGSAESVYEDVNIVLNIGKTLPHHQYGIITAQGNDSPNSPGGFVFKNCKINGVGKAYLGRAYRPYSRVIFSNCNIEDVIVPQGWDIWRAKGHESQIINIEYQCKGPGANRARRPLWSKDTINKEIEDYMNVAHVDDKKWMEALPKV